MGTPDQPPDQDTARGGLAQHLRHLAARAVEPLVRVAAPVGEQDQVAPPGPPDRLVQLGKVGIAVDQRPYLVALAEGRTVGVPPIDAGVRVAALLRGEQPRTGGNGSGYP